MSSLVKLWTQNGTSLICEFGITRSWLLYPAVENVSLVRICEVLCVGTRPCMGQIIAPSYAGGPLLQHKFNVK